MTRTYNAPVAISVPADWRTALGLGNVDNTADTAKPVSTATQTALDAKQALSTITAANQVLIGTASATAGVLDVPASRIVGRDASGNIKALTVAEVKTLLAYTAANITATPTGDVAATTVQDAIAELESEKARQHNFLPTAAVREIYPRVQGATSQAILSSGRLSLFAIRLVAGDLITTVTFSAGSQALVTGSNQWFALFDSARLKLRVTNDDTSTAWSAQTLKTLTLATTYTVTTTGLYYVGICIVAATVPNLTGQPMGAGLGLAAPAIAGHCDTGLTNPASCPGTAASFATPTGYVWGYVG